jgi:uncharacterized protein
MMKDLARWLRAAGYDTSVAPDGAPDMAILQDARREQRVLLTRDRGLLRRDTEGGASHFLRTQNLDSTARELRDCLGVDWLRAPFTRCLIDNSPLRPATSKEARGVPPRVPVLQGHVTLCPSCGRLYWEGSHVRRMRARLTAWQFATAMPHARAGSKDDVPGP